MGKSIRLVLTSAFALFWVAPALAATQDLQFHAPTTTTGKSTLAIMRDLAVRALPVYQDDNRDRYLTNLSALQLVAGNYTAAHDTLQLLLPRLRGAPGAPGAPPRSLSRATVYSVYAHARMIESDSDVSFAQAFTRAFQQGVPRLTDLEDYALTSWLRAPVTDFQRALQAAFDRSRADNSLDLAQALNLVQTYLAFEVHHSLGSFADTLMREDDLRRYITDPNVLIKTPTGARIAAVVVLPRTMGKPLPTLLEFTIHVDPHNDARECAAHGYAGVIAYTRGKDGSPGPVVPYEHDGEDARAVINWIARQPWSSGSVGMYGDRYSGFSAWAAAAHAPRALRAIATSAATAPGIDEPMNGSIFHNSMYSWALEASSRASDARTPADVRHWQAIDQKWYASGASYRDFGRIAGQPNRLFQRWLGHPSYDHYWQRLIPFQHDFARVDIPVLTIAGYYGRNESGALYYFNQHHQYNPHADQTLLLGPYDLMAPQQTVPAEMNGYPLDPAAQLDLHELRYQWFDHILKGRPKPALLRGRVNYEVMGANQWRHASSITAMANASLRLYLDGERPGALRLTAQQPARNSFVAQTVAFADRGDANWMPPANLVGKTLMPHNGVKFTSDPLPQPLEFDGLFTGQLDFTTNKMDMDINVSFYELLPDGQYLTLFNPAFEFRASYADDRAHRHLLKAGERQQLRFLSDRITSRRLAAGSRLIMVLGINKRPDRQINYGTGKDVSEESIADARVPMKLRWYGSSFVDIPVLQ